MNKIHKALFSLFAFFVGHEAYAAVACGTYNGIPSSALIVGKAQHSNKNTGCTGTTTSYIYNGSSTNTFIEVIQCSACISNYKRDYESITVLGCTVNVDGCTRCTGCKNCTSDTSWTTLANGLERKTTARCTDICNETCERSTEYRCVAGYYGSPGNTTSGCYKCPTSGGLEGTSTLGFNETIEDCYFPSGRSVDDTTGTYQFTEPCFYSS